MAVATEARQFDGDIVLLRTHPRSGANAFASALLSVMRHMTGYEGDFVVDLDHLVRNGSVTSYFDAMAGHGPLLVLKTHLLESEFLETYAFLVPGIRCQVRLFRTPLDVAVSTFMYLLQVPGALSDDEQRFGFFFRSWMQAGGNWRGFQASGVVGWQAYAVEALAAERPSRAPIVNITYEEIMISPMVPAVRVALALDRLAGLPVPLVTSSVEAPAFGGTIGHGPQFSFKQETSYFSSGMFGEMVGPGGMTECLRDYTSEFGPIVNRLIREIGVLVNLL